MTEHEYNLTCALMAVRQMLATVGDVQRTTVIHRSDAQALARTLRSFESTLAGAVQTRLSRVVRHGKTCPKAEHGTQLGYLHGADDDRPYDVDGVRYCGRCHEAL